MIQKVHQHFWQMLAVEFHNFQGNCLTAVTGHRLGTPNHVSNTATCTIRPQGENVDRGSGLAECQKSQVAWWSRHLFLGGWEECVHVYSIYMYIYIYIYVCVHVYTMYLKIHIYIYIYIHMSMICICIYIYTYMFMCIYGPDTIHTCLKAPPCQRWVSSVLNKSVASQDFAEYPDIEYLAGISPYLVVWIAPICKP